MTPRVGETVHYVSYGTPHGEFPPACRAAKVTEIGVDGTLGLVVLNPTGLFFHPISAGGSRYDDGNPVAGTPGCPDESAHGEPLRYCGCGWIEPSYLGGTWHPLEECRGSR